MRFDRWLGGLGLLPVFLAALTMVPAGNAPAAELLLIRAPIGAAWADCEGCSLERVVLTDDGAERTTLVPGFVAARDPSVSFDGRSILFAGRREGTSRWQVWRTDRDGSRPVQITSGPGDSFSPLWVGSLFHLDDAAPSERIVYVSTDHGWLDQETGGLTTALYAAAPDGSDAVRITYNMLSDSSPEVLANGRLVFASGTASSDGEVRHGLLAINIDGTDLMAFAGVHQQPSSRKTMIRVDNRGHLYLIDLDDDNDEVTPLTGGRLAVVDLRRPLRGYRRLTADSDGSFASPLPLPTGELLVSYRPPGSDEPLALWRADPMTGRLEEPVLRDATHHLLAVAVLGPRDVVQGRSSVVDQSQDTGVAFCISAFVSDRPEVQAVPTTDMLTLRVIEGVPAVARVGRDGQRNRPASRVLGETGLESDGSFHVELPARTPLRFEILDADRRVVSRQESWTWVMPRESRGCVGCHEDRETAPPNRLAEAVIRPAVSLVRSHGGEVGE